MEKQRWTDLYKLEDWWAVWIGFLLLATVFCGAVTVVPKVASWQWGEIDAAFPSGLVPRMVVLVVGLGTLLASAAAAMKGRADWRTLPGLILIFLVAVFAFVVAEEKGVKYYGIEYVLWALLFGLLISNTVGTPAWAQPAMQTEFYIKAGLVLLGAEILWDKIVAFGPYGIAISWGVVPFVILFMWFFGVHVLKMANKPLVIVIATAASVCGISAAIAAAAASRAKKEDLALAVGMSLIFTVLMMIFMPVVIKILAMDEVLGGAWIGGTVDSTGAVVAAGAALGKRAESVAAMVKMIQNVLIGVVAFFIAVYWVAVVDREKTALHTPFLELWNRFPKFILGFVAASLVASWVLVPLHGADYVGACVKQTQVFRSWLFCLAFVCIGLESNFKSLRTQMGGGKPLVLYVVGQGFNVLLTLLVAWLVLSGTILRPPTGF
ncbi:MAG: putative sulfate exporter family transporter [Candidatus Hydrogenedentes bacterium]|nr:putative sulfate exporter family transporter [Candidatus Hydrogenedentota bacterium]